MPKTLWKTTIEIWTDYNPVNVELDDLAREATSGDGYCSKQEVAQVDDPAQFPETDFFGSSSEAED